LSTEHVAIADALWPNKHAGSLYFLNRLRELNTNIGAFNDDGELMAWCFHQQPGTLGALQVQDKFKRQGLGSWVTKSMAKALADDLDRDTVALVDDDNEASKKMFEKLGFQHIDDAYVSRSLPLPGGNSDWVD
jgi:ribosomal protein S18 acetylase RimI-like enzyme